MLPIIFLFPILFFYLLSPPIYFTLLFSRLVVLFSRVPLLFSRVKLLKYCTLSVVVKDAIKSLNGEGEEGLEGEEEKEVLVVEKEEEEENEEEEEKEEEEEGREITLLYKAKDELLLRKYGSFIKHFLTNSMHLSHTIVVDVFEPDFNFRSGGTVLKRASPN